ncbi:PqqD family protein [Fulvivirgaceae bacterium BMA10]|uniref:PqqD family protein n=1 Tax=Splendidivirga corallicola TaxID=3051826 RepID=A0ABT8KK81_9BACT|nr:PqqD family protein [Fulvivirgaceae bacterium BMA10]
MNNIKESIFSVNDNALIKEIDGEAVIVSSMDAMITSINQTGTFIVNLVKEKPSSYQDILMAVTENFDIKTKEADDDLFEFLNQLIQCNLINHKNV